MELVRERERLASDTLSVNDDVRFSEIDLNRREMLGKRWAILVLIMLGVERSARRRFGIETDPG